MKYRHKEEESVVILYIDCAVWHISKNIMFHVNALYFYERRVGYSYYLTLVYSIRTKFIIQKCIVFGSFDKRKVQRFVMCLSAVVQ